MNAEGGVTVVNAAHSSINKTLLTPPKPPLPRVDIREKTNSPPINLKNNSSGI